MPLKSRTARKYRDRFYSRLIQILDTFEGWIIAEEEDSGAKSLEDVQDQAGIISLNTVQNSEEDCPN
jgi:hypothetical protein